MLLAVSLLLSSCTAQTAPPPTATELLPSPRAETPTPKEAIPATETPSPEPTVTATATRTPGPIELTIWYSYEPGMAEETAFINVVKQVREKYPTYTIRLLRVPYTEIFSKYREEVAAGKGPDMFIAPNDDLGNDARNGLIADITDLTEGKLNGVDERAIQGMSVDGKIYGIPESYKAVTLWYNKSMLSEPPATTDDLKALMENGTPVAIPYNCYHYFGFFGSFGGQLFDENWKFTADQGGFVEALTYLKELYKLSSSNEWPKDDAEGLNDFRLGKMAAFIDGNWHMGDFKNALGGNLAVAPLPAGPGGPAAPFLGVDGFYINPNSQLKDVAVEVALSFTSQTSQTIMMEKAGHVPIRTELTITDSLINGLLEAFQTGYIRPQVAQMNNYWSNFCSTNDIFELDAPIEDWVTQANENANE
jgi:arabinogalactan oligomer/maltooligosaccharide transport system substrate-binding protein